MGNKQAMRDIISLVYAEMESAWNREAIQRAHVHRWGKMLEAALAEDAGAETPPQGPQVTTDRPSSRVVVDLTGDEVATAIAAYMVAHDVNVFGPRTITVNGELCESGRVSVDPQGYVISNGKKFTGEEQ